MVGSRNVGCHSGQLMKVSATLWRMKYVLLFKGHSKHQHVDRGGGGGGWLPYKRDGNASWKIELYSQRYQFGRGLAKYDPSMRPY